MEYAVRSSSIKLTCDSDSRHYKKTTLTILLPTIRKIARFEDTRDIEQVVTFVREKNLSVKGMLLSYVCIILSLIFNRYLKYLK